MNSKEYSQKNKKAIIEKSKNYYQNNKEKEKIRRKKYYEDKKIKILEEAKNYYQSNKEKILKKEAKYYRNNIDKKKGYYCQYNKENRDKRNKYKKNKYDNDPLYRLRINMANAINRSLKSNNISKNRKHWEGIVGYTIKELEKHLEKLFKPGMNWDNRSAWHIDHIIPISFFKYNSMNDVEFKYCWSLNNLQPLWAIDNFEKGDKIIFCDQDR